MFYKVLIVEDEDQFRLIYKSVLGKGFEYLEADTEDAGRALLEKYRPEIVILDLSLSDEGPETGLARIKDFKRPWNKVLVITAFGDPTILRAAINLGASEFIQKDSSLGELLTLRVNNIVQQFEQEKEYQRRFAVQSGLQYYKDEVIIGRSKVMNTLFMEIERVARTKETVLITGPTGSGKELVARAVHYKSPQQNRPFISVNAAAVPETLFESTFFGYNAGAFTGADKKTFGLLDEAFGSTLFIDEVHCFSPASQAKLLRVLQERQFTPLGGTKPKQINVRFIFATNQNLEKKIRTGEVRVDFYYRINQLQLSVPPLKKRKDDILSLSDYLLTRMFPDLPNDTRYELTEDAIAALLEYDWPGNVRELEATLKRACLKGQDRYLRLEDIELPGTNSNGLSSENGEDHFSFNVPLLFMDDAEKLFRKAYANWVFEKAGRNQRQAAHLLSVSPRSMFNYLNSPNSDTNHQEKVEP